MIVPKQSCLNLYFPYTDAELQCNIVCESQNPTQKEMY